jgi:hypothetical protein
VNDANSHGHIDPYSGRVETMSQHPQGHPLSSECRSAKSTSGVGFRRGSPMMPTTVPATR